VNAGTAKGHGQTFHDDWKTKWALNFRDIVNKGTMSTQMSQEIHSFALCLYGEKILQDLEQNPSTTLITYFKLCPKEEVKQESVAVSSCEDVTRDEVEFSLQKAGQFLCYQRGFFLAVENQRQDYTGTEIQCHIIRAALEAIRASSMVIGENRYSPETQFFGGQSNKAK
jgi:hypothetical protein